MKKNRTMRTAALLLALTLMTSCFVGGTFAKYVSTGSASDTARVAKWGVVVSASGDKAFAEAYGAENKAFTPGDDGSYEDATVVAAAETTVDGETTRDKVIAPGTTGSLGGLTITGTPEVDVNVTVSSTLTLGAGWQISVTKTDSDGKPVVENGEEVKENVFYCPLVFTAGTTEVDGKDYLGKKDAFVADVQGLFAISSAAGNDGATAYNYSEDYDANTDLSEKYSGVTVNWEWPFEINATEDVRDTALGDAAADGGAMTIEFSVSATVTQLP